MIDEQERQGSGVKRKFNALVENEMIEDYSLRYVATNSRSRLSQSIKTSSHGILSFGLSARDCGLSRF